jgi:4-amino-4-deoxy-L-arabinose transferase-like glycosyltransferase
MAVLKKYWLIIVLTLAAAVLRLYRIEPSLQFLGDQGRDALVMYRLLTQGDLPFIGPITSVGGFYLGPLYYYLMAPFLWLWRFNPVGPAVATAVLGIITVPALYCVGKKMFSERAAVMAAALYTFAFIPIIETRSAWNPNPMPLAALGIIYGFYLANYQNKPKGLLLAAVSLAAALQLHYMIVFLAPWLLWQLILAIKNKDNRIMLTWSGIIFIGLMLPLILFEVKNNWLNTKGLIEFLTKHKYGQLNLFEVVKNTIGRSEQAIGMILGLGRDFNALRTWVTRIFLVFLIIFFRRFKLLAVYLLTAIVTLAFYQSNVYPHYLGFLFPVVFLLTGAILAAWPIKLRWLIAAILAFFISYNLRQAFPILQQTGNLLSVAKTAEFIDEDIKANGYTDVNLALLDGTRDYPAMSVRYFLTLRQAPLLPIDGYPQTETLYVVSPYDQTDLLEQPMWEIQALLPATHSATWQLPNVSNIYKIERL